MLRNRMLAAAGSLALLVAAATPAAASSTHGYSHDRTTGDHYTDPLGHGRYTDPLGDGRYTDPLGGGRYTDPIGHHHSTDPLGQKGHGQGHRQSNRVSHAALGKYCRSESRRHHSGQNRSPFSLCVTAMAKLANGKTHSAVKACKAESKRHVKGSRGTPFSRCVVAGRSLLHSRRRP